ncbi:MAG: condensation domain-containing protein [Granulicella sp.]
MSAGLDFDVDTQMYSFPAAPLQERIWRLNEVGGVNPAWNVAVRFKLIGTLSVPRFQQALNHVVARTEILRTHFAFANGEINQLVAESLAVTLYFEDCSNSIDFEADLDRISREEAEKPISMQRSPLLRVGLVRRDSEIHYLLVTAHHAIMDGVSIGLLSDSLLAAYEGLELLNTQQAEIEPPLQFADYTLWLKEKRQSSAYQAHAAYWLHSLEGVSAADGSSLVEKTSTAGAHIESLLLPRALTDAARKLCQRLDVTFSQLSLTVFACAAGKLDTIIGIPVASRPEVQLETMIGPFVNYLPLKLTSKNCSNFEQILAVHAEILREALEHSEFRYEDILQAQGLVNQSLFNTVFICQRDFVHSRKTQSIELSAIPSVSPGALHELTVFLVERSDGWRLSCETDGSYTPTVALGLLHHYQRVLKTVCENPLASLSSLTNPTLPSMEIPTDKGHQISFPLSATQERYWALNRIDPGSNRLNLHIRYAVEGSFEPVIFKEALHTLAARHDALRTVFVEQNGSVRQHVSSCIDIPLHIHPDNRMIDAEAVLNLFDQEKQFPFDLERGPLWSVLVVVSGDRSFFALTLSHMISDGWSCGILMRELLVAYDAITAGRAPEFTDLTGSFGEAAVRNTDLNPSIEERVAYWDEILGERSPHLNLPTDAIHEDSVSAVTATRHIDPVLSVTITQIARDYGVTVASVYAAGYRALLLKYTGLSTLLIAMPIANRAPGTETIVGPFADSLLLRSSVGTTFEAALQTTQNSLLSAVEHTLSLQQLMERLRHSNAERGAAVSIGFMYQEAFVRDLTGDHLTLLAMENHLADFSFDWHLAVIDRGGKVDVEFTATDTSMSQHLAALILEDFELSLSCYVLAPRKQLLKVAGLTERVKQICEEAQAKRRNVVPALPSIQTEMPVASPEKVAEMVHIWQELFGRKQITGSDNFFSLGGHSLLLARLQAALEKKFGYRIFAADIFAAPTCELLVYRMNRDLRSDSSPLTRIIPIQPEGTDNPLFVISQSMIVREFARQLGPSQPTFTIQFAQEDVERLGLHASMQQIAALYIEHLRAARTTGPYRLGGWCISGWVAYEMAQQLRAAGEDVELLLILDAWAPNFWRDMRGLAKVFGRTSYYTHRLFYETRQVFTSNAVEASLWSRFAPLRQSIRRTFGAALKRMIGQSGTVAISQTPLDQMMDAAAATYRPIPYSDERTLVFRSAEQPRGGTLPSHMGWKNYLRPGVEIIPLPGDHTGMFSGPGATKMAECVRRKLRKSSSSSSHAASSGKKPSTDLLNAPLCL